MNRICITCNIEIDESNYLKDKTVCRSCYNKKRRISNNNTLIQNRQPKLNSNNDNNPNVSKYENHAYVVIDTRNVGKTYRMLKVIEKLGNKRRIHITTRPSHQYPIYKTSNEIKPINKYKMSVVIIDDKLGARNSSQIDDFFTRGHMKI